MVKNDDFLLQVRGYSTLWKENERKSLRSELLDLLNDAIGRGRNWDESYWGMKADQEELTKDLDELLKRYNLGESNAE